MLVTTSVKMNYPFITVHIRDSDCVTSELGGTLKYVYFPDFSSFFTLLCFVSCQGVRFILRF